MSDIYERVAERMVMAISTDDDAYSIMARKRVRAVAGDETPTIDHYHAALAQCIADKAGDWRAACESAAAASKEIGSLKAENARLRGLNERSVASAGSTAWISVSERLPPEDVEVFVAAFAPSGVPFFYSAAKWRMTPSGLRAWEDDDCVIHHPTHWMPLPAPPADAK